MTYKELADTLIALGDQNSAYEVLLYGLDMLVDNERIKLENYITDGLGWVKEGIPLT